MEACRRELGDTFTLRLSGLPPVVVVSDPRAIKDLVTGDADAFHVGDANVAMKPSTWLSSFGKRSLFLLDGARHQDERRVMTAAFQPERLRVYERSMHACARRAIDDWAIGSRFDLHRAMQELTLGILIETIFGADQAASISSLRRAVEKMLAFHDQPTWLILFGKGGEARVRAAARHLGALSPWTRMDRSIQDVNAAVSLEIARRRQERAHRDDVLSIMIAARDEQGRPLEDEALLDEIRTLLVAGHETTARALTFTIFELLRNGGVLERLKQELEHGDDYLDAVIRETLRLHPIVPLIARQLMALAEVGGRRLPAGTLLACSIHHAHLDGATWSDARQFRPDRFVGTKVEPFEFLPFGQGKRRCLGMAFAMLEMRTVLRKVVTETRLRSTTGAFGRASPRGTSFAAPSGIQVVRDA